MPRNAVVSVGISWGPRDADLWNFCRGTEGLQP